MQSKENQEQQELKSIENSLIALRKLQIIDSKIDKIRTIRGELPLEVRDLEAACEGIETRIHKIEEVIKEFQLPDNLIPEAMMPMGYPAEDSVPGRFHSENIPIDKMVRYL